MTQETSRWVVALAVAGSLTGAGKGWAQDTRPIRVVVPFPPGGGVDTIARGMGNALYEKLGRPIVVDNRTGANGQIGIQLVEKATADGSTLLFVSATFTILPALFAAPPYDAIKGFAPISVATRQPYVIAVPASLPVKNLQDLIDLAKSKPGELMYGSAGSGGGGHLGVEMLKSRTGINMVHVPYKGGAPALTDLIAGRLAMMFATSTMTAPHIRSGRLRVLATTGAKRVSALPDIPTASEAGLTGFDIAGWYGYLAPGATPRDTVARLNTGVREALMVAEVRNRIIADGSEPVGSTVEEFAALIRHELPQWSRIAKQSGAKAD